MIYLELFLCYLKIGFFGFGGGYSMLSLIHHEVVTQHGWISSAALNDIVAISQMTPGPIAINAATYIGYTVAGFWGSVIATISVCLPSLTIMVLITRFFMRLKDNHYMNKVIVAMRPAVIGLIGAASMLLIFPEQGEGASMIDGWSWALFGVAFVASLRKADPIKLIVLSAVAGIAIYYLPTLFEEPQPEPDPIELRVAQEWQEFDMHAPQVIASPEFEQEWVNFLSKLQGCSYPAASDHIAATAQLCSAEPEALLALLDVGEKYLYNPNSPIRNDELFIPILESVIASPKVDSLSKIRPTMLLKRSMLNRVGSVARNFKVDDSSMMHDIVAPLTLLYFYDPTCGDCERTSAILDSAPQVLLSQESGQLSVVRSLVTPSSPLDTLYDLKAIPTLYLLDAQKRVVAKDVSIESILEFLSQNTNK